MKLIRTLLLTTALVGWLSGNSLAASDKPAAKLRHVVAFKYKPEVTPEQMKQVEEAFRALKAKIPQILEFEGGSTVAFQRKQKGFAQCFIVTFKNEADLEIYGPHPDHKAFSKFVDPLLAEVFVVDYWAD